MYVADGKVGVFVELEKANDVVALNHLQYLKCAENIYFSEWSMAGSKKMVLLKLILTGKPRRIE